jgi:hypothetical protein
LRQHAVKLGATPEAAGNLANLDQTIIDRFMHVVSGNLEMRWKIIQRGCWVTASTIGVIIFDPSSNSRCTIAPRLSHVRRW